MATDEFDRASAVGVDDRLVMPVGQFVGVELDDGRPLHQVRVGPQVHDLDDTQFQIWSVAHGNPQAVMNGAGWQLAAVAALVKYSGAADVDELVDDMLADGLLAEVTPGTESATKFAKQHRVTPLMLGLGNTAEETDRYGVGLLGRPMLQVDFVTYDLWQWSAAEETLWATCESAADVARRAGVVDAGRLRPDTLLTNFLRALHGLLVVRAACIDVPFRLNRPAGE